MVSHFGVMLIFAFLVSVVFATIANDAPKDQLTSGAKMFGLFVGAALVLGWLMRIFPL